MDVFAHAKLVLTIGVYINTVSRGTFSCAFISSIFNLLSLDLPDEPLENFYSEKLMIPRLEGKPVRVNAFFANSFRDFSIYIASSASWLLRVCAKMDGQRYK